MGSGNGTWDGLVEDGGQMREGHARAFAAIIKAIDWLNERVGRWTSWLVLTMVINTFLVAVLRYGFDLGWVWLQEMYIWMHGAIIMIGVGYTLLYDGHVRVDIFYRSASLRAKAWINLLGTIFFLFPTIGTVLWTTWPYVMLSWQRLEASREAGGLPGLYLWKTTMLMFCALLFLQALALALRSILVLSGRKDPNEKSSQVSEGA